MEQVGHAQTACLSISHPAAAAVAHDAKGLRPPVRLRQEAPSTLEAIPRRDAVVAAGTTLLAVRPLAWPRQVGLTPATGRAEAASDRLHASLRADPPTVDATPRIVVGDDGTSDANA